MDTVRPNGQNAGKKPRFRVPVWIIEWIFCFLSFLPCVAWVTLVLGHKRDSPLDIAGLSAFAATLIALANYILPIILRHRHGASSHSGEPLSDKLWLVICLGLGVACLVISLIQKAMGAHISWSEVIGYPVIITVDWVLIGILRIRFMK